MKRYCDSEIDNEYQDVGWQKEKRKQRFKNKKKDKRYIDEDFENNLFDEFADEENSYNKSEEK